MADKPSQIRISRGNSKSKQQGVLSGKPSTADLDLPNTSPGTQNGSTRSSPQTMQSGTSRNPPRLLDSKRKVRTSTDKTVKRFTVPSKTDAGITIRWPKTSLLPTHSKSKNSKSISYPTATGSNINASHSEGKCFSPCSSDRLPENEAKSSPCSSTEKPEPSKALTLTQIQSKDIVTAQCEENGSSLVFKKKALCSEKHSIRLLHCKDRRLILNEEALRVLHNIDKAVAVLSICGRYRSGKSYFLSQILGTKDAFTVSPSAAACTDGIWMSTTILECEEFALVLLDTEGTESVTNGDRFKDTDLMKLLVFTTLLSSYLVYNSSGPANKSDLTKLSFFTEIARSVLVRGGVRGKQAENLSRYFPHFLWLWRDNQLDCYDGGNVVSATEYLHKNILNETTGESDSDNVAKCIVDMFPTLQCRQIPHPFVKDPAKDDPSPDFNKAIKDSVDFLLTHIHSKEGFDSSATLTGAMLADLAKHYTEALNTSDAVPNLELGWRHVVKRNLASQAEEMVAAYRKEMTDALKGKLPMNVGNVRKFESRSPDTLMYYHHKIFDAKKELLQQKLEHLVPGTSSHSEIESFQEKIVQLERNSVMRGELHPFITENDRLSQQRCESVFDEILRQQEEIDLRKLREEYMERAVGPAIQDVYNIRTEMIPGPPQCIQCTVSTDTYIALSWTNPSTNAAAAKKYEIQYKPQGQDQWKTDTTDATGNGPHRVTQLSPNRDYSFRVRGTNGEKRGEFSEVIYAKTKPGKPEKPAEPKIDIGSANKATLRVERLSKEGQNGSPVSTVLIESCSKTQDMEWISKSEKIDPDSDGPIVIDIEVPNATEDIQHYYRVKMKNNAGKVSEPSEPACLRSVDLIPGPPQLQPLIKGKYLPRKVILDWTPPKINPASVSKYQVEKKEVGANWTLISNLSLNKGDHSVSIDELKPNSKYQFRVRCSNGQSSGEYSKELEVTTPADRPDKPERPTLEVTSATTATIKAQKANSNGSIVTTMLVSRCDEQGKIIGDSVEYSIDENDAAEIITKKEIEIDNETHYIRICFENEVGKSDWSIPSGVAPDDIEPGVPTKLKASNINSRKLTICWSKPDIQARAAKSYSVEMSNMGEEGPWEPVKSTIDRDESFLSTVQVADLAPYTEYHFRVQAVNKAVPGEYCEPISVKTLADVPGKPKPPVFRVHESDPQKAILSVQKLKRNEENGSEVKTLQVDWSKDSRIWNCETHCDVPIEDISFIEIEVNLESVTSVNFKSYYFRVRMKNEVGTGEPSDIYELPISSIRPGKVTNLKVNCKGSHEVELQWGRLEVHPAIPGCTYTVEEKENNGWLTKQHDISTLSSTIPGLRSNHIYKFRVFAMNREMQGPPAEVSATTEEVFPGPPRKLREDNRRPDVIKVRWSEPDGDPEAIHHYKVEVTTKTKENGKKIDKPVGDVKYTKGKSKVIRGLVSHTEYTIRVTSMNENNNCLPDHGSSATVLVQTSTSLFTRMIVRAVPPVQLSSSIRKAVKCGDEEELISTDEEYEP